jgi:hypothetical protein
MTVTILPGHDTEAGSGVPQPPPPPPRLAGRGVVAAAAALVLAAVGGGAWLLTRSGADPAATPPAPASAHRAHAVKLPAHGRVPTARLRAVATPAFTAMAASLGGWTATGHVHRADGDSSGPADGRFDRCAGFASSSAGQRGLESGKYEGGNHLAQGQVDVMPSAAAARQDLRNMTSPRAAACAKAVVPQLVRHQKLGRYVTATGVSLHRMHGVPHAFRMKLVVGYVVNGHQIPVQMDFLGAVVGRTEVSLRVTSHDTTVAPRREVAALRAMVEQVRPSLR